MSKKYEEYIGGIQIEYNNKLHLCQYKDCYTLKNIKLSEIECEMGDIFYDMESLSEEEKERYDQDEEEVIECDCGNELIFTYNPYQIIKKYF